MIPTTDTALYVHWPWCLAKCPYCDFNAHVWDDIPTDAYVAALRNDMVHMAEIGGKRRISSIFFGGGTPSLMGAAVVARILDAVAEHWNIADSCEITVECNPTSSSRELFAGLADAGVNRLSLGVQSTRADWLAFLGRKHDVYQALTSLDAAQSVLGNVNADLIFGLPTQDVTSWSHQLREMAGRGLSHLSCYQLTIEPQTRFFGAVKRGEWAPLDGDTQADFMAETRHILAEQGYTGYEVSNHARAGAACRHNLHVWRYGDYLGIGAGAHGRLLRPDGQRVATQVTKHPRNYLARARSGGCTFRQTPLGAEDVVREMLLSGLRLREGTDLERISLFSGLPRNHIVSEKELGWLRTLGLVEGGLTDTPVLRLTDAGMAVMDSVVAALIPAASTYTKNTPLLL